MRMRSGPARVARESSISRSSSRPGRRPRSCRAGRRDRKAAHRPNCPPRLKRQDGVDRRQREPRALGEMPAVVLAALAQQLRTPSGPSRSACRWREHDEAAARVLLAGKADRLVHAIEHLAAVDLDDVVAAGDPQALHGVRGIMQIGVGGRRGGADGVGVELHELRERPGPASHSGRHGQRGRIDRALAAGRSSARRNAPAAR